jgi:hypothetical protein
MVQLITNPTFRGNKRIAPASQGPAIYATDLDFASQETYRFDFTTLQQGEEIGLIETLYLDNSVNPKPAEINVSQTGQFIVCPPFSVGYFPLFTQENSVIEITSDGGVLNGEKCYAAFYTKPIPPAVWNGFAPLVDGARVTLIGVDGITNMSATNPLIVGGNNSGAPVPLKVDGTGRLEVIGSSSGGVAFGPDAPATTPTQSPLQMSGVDGGGLVRRILTTTTGLLRVTVDSAVTGASSIQVQGAGAAGSGVVGNPVQAGGIYTATLPTLTDGAAGRLQLTSRGSLNVTLITEAGAAITSAPLSTEGLTTGAGGLTTISANYLFDGTNWDRARSVQAPSADLRAGLGVQAFGGFGQFLTTPYTLTNGQYGELQLTAAGDLKVAVQGTPNVTVANTPTVSQQRPNAGTTNTVSVVAAATTLLAANAARRAFTLWNAGTLPVNVRFNAGASGTVFSFILQPGGYYEWTDANCYTGIITGFASSANNVLVTEIT